MAEIRPVASHGAAGLLQLGAGIENHLGGRFTTRLEYLYTAYGDDGLSFTAPNDSAGFASHTLRAGLGLRF